MFPVLEAKLLAKHQTWASCNLEPAPKAADTRGEVDALLANLRLPRIDVAVQEEPPGWALVEYLTLPSLQDLRQGRDR